MLLYYLPAYVYVVCTKGYFVTLVQDNDIYKKKKKTCERVCLKRDSIDH